MGGGPASPTARSCGTADANTPHPAIPSPHEPCSIPPQEVCTKIATARSCGTADTIIPQHVSHPPSTYALPLISRSMCRSAHFTNCGKPWECRYPHKKQPLCSRLVERWFQMRARVRLVYVVSRCCCCCCCCDRHSFSVFSYPWFVRAMAVIVLAPVLYKDRQCKSPFA